MLPQADRSQSHFKSSGLTSSDEMQNMHKKKMPVKTTISFSSQWQTSKVYLIVFSFFLLLNSTKLSYIWILSQKPCMCEKQWDGPRVCKCLTWRGFTKFTNTPFPGLTRRTNGRQSVCVWGEGCTSTAGIDWCTMWNHANYGVYPLLESITSLASMMWSITTPSLKWRSDETRS